VHIAIVKDNAEQAAASNVSSDTSPIKIEASFRSMISESSMVAKSESDFCEGEERLASKAKQRDAQH
jgi:hypothetical protein